MSREILHPRNSHNGRYDFQKLTGVSPELARFVGVNPYGTETINFADPEAVKALNGALLKCDYGIGYWDIPPGYLCPPIPGRADYIHNAADLLAASHWGEIPRGAQVQVLDIGVGANCVYPIIGRHEYGWSFTGSEINPVSLHSAQAIVTRNHGLRGFVRLKLQESRHRVFQGIIGAEDRFDLSLCNPPFHSSKENAEKEALRKLKNLGLKPGEKPVLNFGGQSLELWCEGGEEAFVNQMVRESREFAGQVLWFTTLISKSSGLSAAYKALKQVHAADFKTLGMAQGQKVSRLIAWTFFSEKGQRDWYKAPDPV